MLPVHCCCRPQTRLGFVPIRSKLPANVAMFQVLSESGAVEKVIVTSVATLQTEMTLDESVSEALMNGALDPSRLIPYSATTIVAVKSNHEPIEVWRRVPGFVDDL